MGWRDLLPTFERTITLAAQPMAPVVPTQPGPRDDVVTAAALDVSEYTGRNQFAVGDQGWQNELWDYFEGLGEFAFVVNWKASTASRVRLRAGRIEKGADEPTIETSGVAAELVADLSGGVGAQSSLLSDLMTQLSVPGEGWLVGETRDGVEYWCVKSNSEIRRARSRRSGSTRATVYEVIDEYSPPATNEWRELDPDSLVVRVWRPHPRRHNEAYSAGKSARSTMRELELVNRKIIAQYLSRLASAGILLLPDEIEFPVRPEFVDAANPVFMELIAVASEAIKTPGSAAAAVPIPFTGPAEFLDKIRHLDMSMTLDDKEIEKRDSVLRRLAAQLDVPGEVLTGVGAMNHWGAWAVDEQAFKSHVAPDIETIVNALTIGYLRPRLAAMGEDPSLWAVWYDASEVIQRPDKSQHADVAYKSLEISPEAYRREMGFDEADAPTEEELQEMLLKRLAVEPALGPDMLEFIADPKGYLKSKEQADQEAADRLAQMPSEMQPGAQPEPAPDAEDENGPPATQKDQQPAGQNSGRQAAQARRDELLARLVDQAKLPHRVTYSAVGPPVLMHPIACREHLPSCPFTHAFARRSPMARPGTSGTYECRLSTSGALALGPRSMSFLDDYVSYTPGVIHFNGRHNGTALRS
jgi:hypothetical protein